MSRIYSWWAHGWWWQDSISWCLWYLLQLSRKTKKMTKAVVLARKIQHLLELIWQKCKLKFSSHVVISFIIAKLLNVDFKFENDESNFLMLILFHLASIRQQGFGVVCVALASQGVTLMTGLLEDVKVEGWTPPRPPDPARLDPLETYTATERLARLFSAVPLNQLLFYLATISYRKVKCDLMKYCYCLVLKQSRAYEWVFSKVDYIYVSGWF